MDDVRAVMDAAGSERAVLFGVSESAPLASSSPPPTPSGRPPSSSTPPTPRSVRQPDYPIGVQREEFERAKTLDDHPDWHAMIRGWLGLTAPDAAADAETLQWYVTFLAWGAARRLYTHRRDGRRDRCPACPADDPRADARAPPLP